MLDAVKFDEFLSKATVLRYSRPQEWERLAFYKGSPFNHRTPPGTLNEEFSTQSLVWASKLRNLLEEAKQKLRGTPLPEEIFELKNSNAIYELC